MSRLLVIFHIYYHDQVDYFISKLGNISACEWDLVVTYSAHNDETLEKLRRFKPDFKAVPVENKGYDVWPFISILKETDTSKYDYVLKIHTKHPLKNRDSINGVNLQGFRWRDYLVDSVLKSRRRFLRCLSILEHKPKAGMICSYELFKSTDGILPEDTYRLEEEMKRIGMQSDARVFCAGTMFLARTDVFRKIWEATFEDNAWDSQNRSHSTGFLAHVYERMLSIAVYDAGYKIRCTSGSLPVTIKAFYRKEIKPRLR